MAPPSDPANHPHILLLCLPLEVIHTIFSFLATDSLANVSLTCHAALRAVSKLPTWTRHHFRIENVYNKREEFASAIERAIALSQRARFCGNARVFASRVVSITLDRDFLPVGLDLIFRILDSFTALREASFVGCIESGSDFVVAAARDGRNLPWTSRSLQRLDLSDSEAWAKCVAKGPFYRGDSRRDVAWNASFIVFLDDPPVLPPLKQLLTIFDTVASVYPRTCVKCNEGPAYSWSHDDLCQYCHKPDVCVDCGSCIEGLQPGASTYLARTSCHRYCSIRVKLCSQCRRTAGWIKCCYHDCGDEVCPNCVGPCKSCGKLSSFCVGHALMCECMQVCQDCLERAECEVCQAPLNGGPARAGITRCESHTCPYCHTNEQDL